MSNETPPQGRNHRTYSNASSQVTNTAWVPDRDVCHTLVPGRSSPRAIAGFTDSSAAKNHPTTDPTGKRRLGRVAQACKDFGQRVQLSVFERQVENGILQAQHRLGHLEQAVSYEDSIGGFLLVVATPAGVHPSGHVVADPLGEEVFDLEQHGPSLRFHGELAIPQRSDLPDPQEYPPGLRVGEDPLLRQHDGVGHVDFRVGVQEDEFGLELRCHRILDVHGVS